MGRNAGPPRRFGGVICLTGAAALLVAGLTVLASQLRGVVFLAYWLVCFGLTLAAFLFALFEMRAVRRWNVQEQRRLIEQTLEEATERAASDPGTRGEGGGNAPASPKGPRIAQVSGGRREESIEKD